MLFTKLCNQQLRTNDFVNFGTDHIASITFETTHSDVNTHHYITINSQVSNNSYLTPAIWSELQKRILCHVMIDRMPSKGLDESCENLINAWKFYLNKSKIPEIEEKQKVIRRQGTIVSKRTRPEFYVSED